MAVVEEEGSGQKVGSGGGDGDESVEVGEIDGVGVKKVWERQGGGDFDEWGVVVVASEGVTPWW